MRTLAVPMGEPRWSDAWVAVRVEASDGEDRIYDTLATKAAET